MTFAEYATELEPTIRHLLGKYSGMKTEAEDLHQEALMLIWQIKPKLDTAQGADGYKKLFNAALQNRLKQITREEHLQLQWISQGMTEATEARGHIPVGYLHDDYFDRQRQRSHDYYMAHREEILAKRRARKARDPERVLAQSRESYRRRRDRMTPEELEESARIAWELHRAGLR